MEISNFKLGPDEFAKLERVLSSLAAKTTVDSIFLINRNGQEIARHGSLEVDAVALSSLAASNLAAALELGALIGEPQLERLYLRGRRLSLVIRPTGRYALLLLVIPAEKEPNVDIRYLKRAALVVDDLLERSVETREPVGED